MIWNIENDRVVGLGTTNDKAREYSYAIVKTTDKRETLLAVCPTKEEAMKVFSTMRCLLNMDASEKKSPVASQVVLRRIMKVGTITNGDLSNPRIRWEYMESKIEKIQDVRKYSVAHARKLVKRNL